jgi:selenoprotein W-related protein
VQIEIEYCVPCGYLPRATDAQTTLLKTFGNRLESVSLKTGRKGVFTFRADGEVIYSKPDVFSIDTIVERVGELLPEPEFADGVRPEGRDLLAGKLN